MPAKESKAVVYVALAGNLAIAIVKGVAAALTGAGAMLSEALHSLVDTLDQVLLLVGQERATRPADAQHPFGHGLEIYFWSFTVALMVFFAGGVASITEGVLKLRHPGESGTPWINYVVLGVSALFEGASFTVGYRQFRRFTKGRVGLASFIRRSKDPNLFVTLMEDGAALIGLSLAALGVAGSQFGLRWADGGASIAIGLLLVAVAVVLGNETRSLIAGEAADVQVVEGVRKALRACASVVRVEEVATLQLGPDAILVAVTLDLSDNEGALEAAQASVISHIRSTDDRIARVYFRPATAVAEREGERA